MLPKISEIIVSQHIFPFVYSIALKLYTLSSLRLSTCVTLLIEVSIYTPDISRKLSLISTFFTLGMCRVNNVYLQFYIKATYVTLRDSLN